MIALRPARQSETEAETLVAIWAEAARAAHPFLPGEGRGERRRLMRDMHLPAATVTVAEADGAAQGFLAMTGGGRIGGLFVRPGAQRRGIGRALVGAAGDGPLTADVYLRNEAGLAFWRAMDFAEAARGLDGQSSEVVVTVMREARA